MRISDWSSDVCSSDLHLKAWVERMNAPQPGAGEFLANDEIPATLQPLFDALFGEFWPMLVGIRDELQRSLPTMSPQRTRLPRSLGQMQFPMGPEIGRASGRGRVWPAV